MNIDHVHDFGLDIDNRRIYLFDNLTQDGDNLGIDSKVASLFIKNLHILNTLDNKVITVILMSDGGYVDAGYLIYDAIKKSKSQVNIEGHGSVSSMASVILQAGKIRKLSQHCVVLIHHGSIGVSESRTLTSLQSYMDFSKAVDTPRMMSIYAERCKNGEFFKQEQMSVDKIKKWIDNKMKATQDWWLNAEEAKYYGFCDLLI